MRVGISGTHGTGKTTLAGALCARLPGHVMADEPYYLLEEEGYELGFLPSLEDYRVLLARSLQSPSSPPLRPAIVFDRTPLDYLAYMAAIGSRAISPPSPWDTSHSRCSPSITSRPTSTRLPPGTTTRPPFWPRRFPGSGRSVCGSRRCPGPRKLSPRQPGTGSSPGTGPFAQGPALAS